MAKSSCVALIVDRNSSARKSLTTTLRQGLQVNEILQANSAQEAMNILKTASRIDWLFCDTSIPDQDCFSFLNDAKKLPVCAETAFILMSSQTNKELLIKAASSGVHDFVKKPFTSNILLAKLRRLKTGAEHRATTRHSLLGAYSSKIRFNGLELDGRLLDISLGGCQLACQVPDDNRFTVFDQLEIEFEVNGKSLTIKGETVRIERNPGSEDKSMLVAFQFVDLQQDQRDLLTVFISTIQAPKKSQEALKKSA